MKYLLASVQRSLLLQYASSNVLLTFDYDGTLAPIVADREGATMREKTRRLLAQVSRLYPCAVITGRALADIAGFLEGIPLQRVIGNHGLEPHQRMGHFKRLASRVRRQIEVHLARVPGVELEDKVYSLAIHYRRSRHRAAARDEVMRIIARVGVPVRTIAGKLVINILPKDAPDKGVALRTLRAELSADAAIYVGDDDTDEDVFTNDQPDRVLGVRVGRASNSAAQFYIRNQLEVDDLLRLLANARRHARVLGHGS